ncbi:MAG: hypothetical protein AB7P16_27640 [Bradyrhizobium sp.]|uniref:hypothetical protein n=1 Tax=Bradyrhizobium sp. TaxID=376 RepID=UPI003D0A6DAC
MLKHIHANLPPLTDEVGSRTYGEIATDNLRRIIFDLGVQMSGSPEPLDLGQLQQRVVFTLALIEAHDLHIPRYDLDENMPFSGRDDRAFAIKQVLPGQGSPQVAPTRRRPRNRDR